MLRRTPTSLLWGTLPRIVFEDDAHQRLRASVCVPPTAGAAAAQRRQQQADATAEHDLRREQRLRHLCGGADSALHAIVARHRPLKQYVENMPSAESAELASRSVLDRKRELAARLCEEQTARVLAARRQLREAKRHVRLMRAQARK